MKKKIVVAVTVILGILALVLFVKPAVPDIRDFQQMKEYPKLFPDYTGIVVPSNLAPINFEIKETGESYMVRISGENGPEISVYGQTAMIRIPQKKWKSLLEQNLNDSISLEVYVKQRDLWRKFKTFRIFVSKDRIDPFVFYRDIVPTNGLWNKMYMHQRNLADFTETELYNNHRTDHNCMNCHTFNKNNPDQMLFHVRGKHGGTIFYDKGKLTKVNLKTSKKLPAGAYCSWHPSGKLVAFAVNVIKQNYYLSGYNKKMKEVFDLKSDLIFYDVEKNVVFTFPQISSLARENLPCWSPDGKYLYYTQAKEYVEGAPNETNLYSLMRVSYDLEKNVLGKPEVILSEEVTKKSVAFPTISPDGRYMLFCMVDFGYFPINNKTSDLYLMDMQTHQYYKPDINSDESESYVSWSSNSRWFVFSSRRMDGVTSKPYFCHVSSYDKLSKPFVLPQEDPACYKTDHRNFTRPELIKARFKPDFRDLKKVIYPEAMDADFVEPAQ